MLDPLTALGLVGNLLQVIEFGYRLVQEGNEIYQSAEGASTQNQDAEVLADDLAKLTKSLAESERECTSTQGDASLTEDESRLLKLCERCAAIANSLEANLRHLKVRDGAKSRTLRSYKQALVTVWTKYQVESIAARLERYRREIHTHILVDLRKSAATADLRSIEHFNALDQRTKDIAVEVLKGNGQTDATLSDHGHLLSRIYQNTTHILNHTSPSSTGSSVAMPKGVLASAATSSPRTPLREAAEAGDALMVRQLIRQSTRYIHAKDERGRTPLHLALTQEVVDTLLDKGFADPDCEDNNGRTALHCAVLKRRHGVIDALLRSKRQKADKSIEDDFGKTAAWYARDDPVALWPLKDPSLLAVYGGSEDAMGHDWGLMHMAWLMNLEGVKFFLGQGGNVETKCSKGNTALIIAARNGDIEMCELLIRYKAKLERFNREGCRALLQAVRSKRLEVVACLLKRGADKEARLWRYTSDDFSDGDSDHDMRRDPGNTALMEALTLKHYDIARELVNADCNVSVRGRLGWTPLMIAARDGEAAFVTLLLQQRAQIMPRDVYGLMALHLAAQKGHLEVLRLLMETGAPINQVIEPVDHWASRDLSSSDVSFSDNRERRHRSEWWRIGKYGSTVLGTAARNGHLDCVTLLLAHRADPNVTNLNGEKSYMALAHACKHGRLQIVELLLDNGADPDSPSPDLSAVTVAAAYGNNAVIRLIAARRPDLRLGIPLHHAAARGHPTTVKLLAELGPNIDDLDDMGSTALFRASFSGREACVRVLIEAGAGIDVQNQRGHNALMMAAANGQMEIVQILVDAGANLQLKDISGRTAWLFAVENAKDHGLETLLKPTSDAQPELCRMQAEKDPSEIAAYMNQRYA